MSTLPISGVSAGDQSKFGTPQVANVSATVAPDGLLSGKVSFQHSVYYVGQTGATIWFTFDQTYSKPTSLNTPFVFGGDAPITAVTAGDQTRFGLPTAAKTAQDFTPVGWDSAAIPKPRIWPYVENGGAAVDFAFANSYDTPTQLNTPFYFGGNPVVTAVTLGDQSRFGQIQEIKKPREVVPTGIASTAIVGRPRVGVTGDILFAFVDAYDRPTTYNVPFYFGAGLAISAGNLDSAKFGVGSVNNAAATVAPSGIASEVIGRATAYFQGQNGVNVDFNFAQSYNGQTPLNTPFYFAGFLNINVGGIDSLEPGVPYIYNETTYAFPTGWQSSQFGAARTARSVQPVGVDTSQYGTADFYTGGGFGGIEPGEFGTAEIDQRIRAIGLGPEAFGTAGISPQFVRPTGWAGEIGAVVFDQTLTTRYVGPAGGISSLEMGGGLKVDPRFIEVPGFSTLEMGGAKVDRNPSPVGIPPGDFGPDTRVDDGKQFVSVDGIAPDAELPQPVVAGRWEYVEPPSLVESGIFGDAAVKNAIAYVTPDGFDSSEFPNYEPHVANRTQIVKTFGHQSSEVGNIFEKFSDYFLDRYSWSGSDPGAAIQLTGLSLMVRNVFIFPATPNNLTGGPYFRDIVRAVTNGSTRAVLEWESSAQYFDSASGSAIPEYDYRVYLSDLEGNVLSTTAWNENNVISLSEAGWLDTYSDGFIVRTLRSLRRYSFTTGLWSTLTTASDPNLMAAAGNLLAVATNSNVTTYNPVTGAQLWNIPVVAAAVATDGTDVFVIDGYTLTRYRGSDGQLLSTFDTASHWDYSEYPTGVAANYPNGLVVAAGKIFIRRYRQIAVWDYSFSYLNEYAMLPGDYPVQTHAAESRLSLTGGCVLAGGVNLYYGNYSLVGGYPISVAYSNLLNPDANGIGIDPVTLKRVWNKQAYTARTYAWLRDRAVTFSSGIGPEAFGTGTDVGLFVKYVEPDGLDSAAFGPTTVANTARLIDLTNYGIPAIAFGTAMVAPSIRFVEPDGASLAQYGTEHFVDFGVRPIRNAGAILGSEYGTAVVESTIRSIGDLFGWDSSAFGLQTTWFRIRTVKPGSIAYQFPWLQFGGALKVEDATKYISGAGHGWISSRFGTTHVARNEVVVEPPSIVGAIGQPDVQWLRRYIKPQTAETFTEYGTAWVNYNPRYVQQYADTSELPFYGGVGKPEMVENRNKTITNYGWVSSRFNSGNFVYNDARVLEQKGSDSALYGTAFVSDAVRTITAQGHESSTIFRWTNVYNSTRTLEPSGIPRLYVGLPYVWSNTQFVDLYGSNNLHTGWGDAFVAHAVREITFVQAGGLEHFGIPPGSAGKPYVGLYSQYVEPAGMVGGVGDHVFELHRDIIKPWGEDTALYGKPAVANVTPELKPLGWQEFEIVWTHYVGLYTRTVDQEGQSIPPPHEFLPRPVVEFRTKTINVVPGINALRIPLLHDVRFDVPELPIPQRVDPQGFGIPEPPDSNFGTAVLRPMPRPPGWVSSRFGSAWVRVQGCSPLWDFPDSVFGMASLNRPIILENVSIDKINTVTTFGKPAVSPFTIWATADAPAQAKENHPGLEYETVKAAAEFGQPFVSLKSNRTIFQFHRSREEGDQTVGEVIPVTALVDNKIRKIRPDGIEPKKFGFPELPTLGELFVGNFMTDSYGEPTITLGAAPVTDRTLTVGGVNTALYGTTKVELFNRTLQLSGYVATEFGNNTPMVYFPRGPTNVGGTVTAEYGVSTVDFLHRTIHPLGSDLLAMEYEVLFFNERLRVFKKTNPVLPTPMESTQFGVAEAKLRTQMVYPYQIEAPRCLGHDVLVIAGE